MVSLTEPWGICSTNGLTGRQMSGDETSKYQKGICQNAQVNMCFIHAHEPAEYMRTAGRFISETKTLKTQKTPFSSREDSKT